MSAHPLFRRFDTDGAAEFLERAVAKCARTGLELLERARIAEQRGRLRTGVRFEHLAGRAFLLPFHRYDAAESNSRRSIRG